jgi:hypothetical protein
MTKDEALKVEGPLHVVCQCNWCKAHQEQNLSCKSVQARLAAAWGFVKAQPEPWEKFCDSNCVWTDHHPDCKLAQRTWAGLTDEDIGMCLDAGNGSMSKIISFIEAKLKEKNT